MLNEGRPMIEVIKELQRSGLGFCCAQVGRRLPA